MVEAREEEEPGEEPLPVKPKKPRKAYSNKVEVYESEEPQSRFEEPWAPASLVVSALINQRQVYVSRFNKKQIRFLSEAAAAVALIKKYLAEDVGWLEVLLIQYTRLSKYEDGWAVQKAVEVAKGSTAKMNMMVSRLKRILLSEE